MDQSDQTYTIAGTSMSTFITSGLGHFCAAVPTVQALIRYVITGIKNQTQVSPTCKNRTSYESRKKKSYKSLEGASNYSDDTLKVSKQMSKEESRYPYRLSTQQFSRFEIEESGMGDDQFVELQPMKSIVMKHPQPVHGSTRDQQGHYGGQPPVTIMS